MFDFAWGWIHCNLLLQPVTQLVCNPKRNWRKLPFLSNELLSGLISLYFLLIGDWAWSMVDLYAAEAGRFDMWNLAIFLKAYQDIGVSLIRLPRKLHSFKMRFEIMADVHVRPHGGPPHDPGTGCSYSLVNELRDEAEAYPPAVLSLPHEQ